MTGRAITRSASILTVGLAALLEMPAPALAQEAVPPPRTHTVVVGGHAMRAQSWGLDARRSGEPVVVFEAGATNPLDVWDAIAPQVSEYAAVVTYDRAGLGQSAWDDVRPTPQHVAARLTTLLKVHDRTGERELAARHYRCFMARWLGADQEYGVLVQDVEARLSELDPLNRFDCRQLVLSS